MKKILPLFIVPAALVHLAPLHAQLSGTSLEVGTGNSLNANGYSGAIGSDNSTSVTYGNYGASLQIGNSNTLEDPMGVLSVGVSNYGLGVTDSAMIGMCNNVQSMTSAVIGSYNTVSATTDSLVVGSYNSVNSNNGVPIIVAGQNNDITFYNGGFAFGTGLAANSSNVALTLFGQYNDTDDIYNNNGSIFVIGNGSDAWNRRNAFEVYQNGDVKIPGGKLSVFATPSSTSGIVLDAAAGQITINGEPLLAPNASGFVGIGTSAPIAKLDVRGTVSVGTPATPVLFADSTNGRVGINTTSFPTGTALRVAGGGLLLGSYSGNAISSNSLTLSNNSSIKWSNDSGNNTFNLLNVGWSSGLFDIKFGQGDWTGATGRSRYLFDFDGVNGSTTKVIFDDGSVGIGTTTPSETLHVNGTSRLAALKFFNYGSGEFENLNNGNLRPHLGATGSFEVYSGSVGSGTSKFIIRNSGDVGVGTANPQAKLDVNGDLKVSGTVKIVAQGDISMGEFAP